MNMSGDQEIRIIKGLYKHRRTAVLTGPAALRVMGFKTLDWVKEIDLVLLGRTRPKGKSRWRRGFRYRSGRLDPCHVAHVRGIKVTTLVMALFDTYRYYGRLPALVSIESALQHPRVSKALLRRQAAALPQSQGVRGFRQLIEDASNKSESPLETIGHDAIVNAVLPGIESVEQQVSFFYCDSNGRPRNGRADMEVNGCIVIELDGRSKARNNWEIVTRDERARERWLLRGEKLVIRATWEQVVGGELVAMLRRALRVMGFA